MAAVAQVRLRSGDGCRGARPRQAPRPGALRHLVPCRLAAAQGKGVGSRAGDGLDGVPRLCRARHQPVHGQYGRRIPDQVPQGRSSGRAIRAVDLPCAAQALRQPDPGDHHRAGPPHDGAEMTPCVLAGPTCDSADVLYEKMPYPLPVTLEIGDKVLIEGTGAYTSTYSSVAFNGFPPLRTYHI